MKTYVLSWPSGREEYANPEDARERLAELRQAGEDVTPLEYTVEGNYINLRVWGE